MHTRGDHWITASSVKCEDSTVKVYESVYSSLDGITEDIISRHFQSGPVKPTIKVVCFQKQKGAKDCGLFAIACAAAIAFGVDPAKLKLNQEALRLHFVNCLKKEELSLFPTHS